jgi:signal transduction histidine kinase/ActR/RegA family two-component response regulator
MADQPDVINESSRLAFGRHRVAQFLDVLEMMAAGDTSKRLAISDRHDELDAIAHGINVLVGELGWTTARVIEAQEERAVSAERANASKNTFLRNMSHEIRTPISAMLGFADLLASSDLGPQERSDLLSRLQSNGQAVMSLLEDLLDLARLDAHKVVLSPESVCVIDLVREVLDSLEFDSRPRGLLMQIDAARDALGSLHTDRYRLRQILVNVVSNAIKFTDAGRIVVSLRTMRDEGGEQWTIDMTDTGIGLAPEQHPHLFEPFSQANASIAKVYGGNGLGLTLSRRLARQLGGELTLLRSAPGQGATFRLTLRPLDGSSPSRESAVEIPNQSFVTLRGLRVLLAEDHRDLHLSLRKLLEREGASVESAYDGGETVARAMATTFDVILMDLRMPDMDGFQATRSLRSKGCRVPIVALTADPATVHRVEALDAGCDGCLSKPFKLDDLIASIQAASGRSLRAG